MLQKWGCTVQSISFLSHEDCLLSLSNFTFIVLLPTHLIRSLHSTQSHFFKNTNQIISLIYQRTHITFIQLSRSLHGPDSVLWTHLSLVTITSICTELLSFFWNPMFDTQLRHLHLVISCVCVWPGIFFPLLISMLLLFQMSSQRIFSDQINPKKPPN